MASSNNLVFRKRLMKYGAQMPDCRILYVQAPAGYGKTVFAGQWLEEEKKWTKALVTFDRHDNTVENVGLKLRILAGQLDAPGLETKFRLQPVAIEWLLGAVSAIPREGGGRIVLDDFHYLSEPSVQKVILEFLMRLPVGIKVCILSRNALPGLFSGLVLKNEIRFLFQNEMLFDSSEICSLYRGKELLITKKEADRILAYTEGWPMGLNALLISEKQFPTESMSQDLLEDFLKSQVWELWEEELREFMVATCMEEELSVGLCNALTDSRDSKKLLIRLQAEGAFLTRQGEDTYRFHRLFRKFLKKRFLERTQEYRDGKIRSAGQWYKEQKDFYHAVERFSSVRDYQEIAGCFDWLEDMDRAAFNMEQIMRTVRGSLREEIGEYYPNLYFMMAVTARNEGKIQDFIRYTDQYYASYPQIIKRNPEFAHNIFFLYMMDFRYTLQEVAELAANVKNMVTFRGVRGSATSYFPFYHRSYRDFSELLPGEIEENVGKLGRILGPLLGKERDMLMECIQAGLYYEKGNLRYAKELTLLAAAKLRKSFAPESKFCVLLLLLMINHAMHQVKQEEMVQKEIEKMIGEDKAFYLQPNFEAMVCRNRLDSGDALEARKWLGSQRLDVYDRLDLFGLYGYFTTARAFIVVENYDQAVIVLEKILELCKELKRPTDVIEAEVLLAIAFERKRRGSLKRALAYLEMAVLAAQPLGYEQVFINEGVALEKMLAVLKNWTMRGDYRGELSDVFVKKLYFGVAEQAQYGTRASGGEKTVLFTQQQKRVASLMCEGYSYRKIAEELGIAFSTVRSHIELIYRKLDVSNMKDAVLKIRDCHILEEL